jgi:osmotically-inducible protein OsmY
VPKGDVNVNVNVENGAAVLRGQVQPPELIEDLGQRVRRVRVNGVRDVASLLHVQA